MCETWGNWEMKGKKLNTERGRVVFGENRGKTFRGVVAEIIKTFVGK